MNGTEKNILLVEDEPIAQMLYRKRLQREGFNISFAEDGELALSALAKVQPDLVVLDLMLPKVNGTEVLKHIRTEERLKKTPVLVISNAYMSELSQKALESGATRGMLKTECTPARLVETVREMLGYRSAFDLSDAPLSNDKQMAEFTAAAEAALADEMALKETRDEFIQKASSEVAKVRELCLAYIKAGTPTSSQESLSHLYKQVRFFATRAGLSGCVRTALVANAFEALLFETLFKPAKASPSAPQTFAQAVDCLERLCQDKGAGNGESIPKAKILVVDDDAVCNLAMVGALRRAHFEPFSVEDPFKAIEKASTNRYDVVFLDINMPGINGFELCKRLRTMPEYKETPVIFITSNGDFQNRAQSILSGGNDLIPKPVSPVELVLKTTMRLLQPQTRGPEKAAPAAKPRQTAPPEIAALPFTVPSETEIVRKGANGAFLPMDTLKTEQPESELEILEKLSASHDAHAGLKIKLPGAKDELPKAEEKLPVPAEPIVPALPAVPLKLAESEVKVEAPKAAEPEKLSISADINKEPAKPATLEVKTELPKPETAAAQPTEPAPGLKMSEPEAKVEISAPAASLKMADPEAKVEAPAPAAPLKTIEPEAKVEPPAPATSLKMTEPEIKVEKVETPKPVEAEIKTELPKPLEPEKETAVPEAKKEEEKLEVEPPKSEPKPVNGTKVDLSVPIEKIELPQPEKIIEPPKAAEPEKAPEIHEVAASSQPQSPAPEKTAESFAPNTTTDTTNNNKTATMETKTKPTFDEAARGVARIIFGDDNISDMNVRLTRIALERYNVPGQNLDEISRGVAKIIFGDEGLSDMNVRLTRIALQSYNITEVLGQSNGVENKVVAL